MLLCDAPPQLANSRVRHVIDALRDALQKHAVIMETRLYPRATAGLDRKLQALTDRLSPAAWVLTRSSLAVQEWFARHDLPVLVNGTAYPDMSLPAFGTDFYAVGRHAAGLFIARGYRRLIMLAAHQQPAGDMEAARGFEAGIKSSTDGVAADHQILRFEGDRNAFRAQLDELLHGCKPPLAFFCAYAAQALALLCHARGLGYAIPRDIGLIARVDDPLLEWTIPAIACYRIDITLYVRRLARLIMQLVRDGALPPKAFCIVPEFFPGESVAASGGRPVVSSP